MNWNAWKVELETSGKAWRDLFQTGLVYAMEQYREHGRSTCLTEAVTIAHECGLIGNGKKVIDFLLDHAPSLEWTNAAFATRKDEGKNVPREARTITMKWWKFKAEPLPKDVVPHEEVVRLVNKFAGAKEKGTLKGDADDNKVIFQALNELVASLKAA